MSYEITEKVEELSNKVELIFDIINQLEVNNLIPPKIIERSRNRIRLEKLRKEHKINPSDDLSRTIKECMDKELILHKKIQELFQKKE